MSFDAKVYRILIASPGDVSEERTVIPEVINDWNAVSAFQTRLILMPVKWETHSTPILGDRPQAIINEQLVNECDLLVGVFWSRIGTHTGVAMSGTAEEIEQFYSLKKPVMLYFSQSPIDPDRIDLEQFTILRTFKEKMRLQGLTESYAGIPDFRQKFSRQLAIRLNEMINKLRAEEKGGKVSTDAKIAPPVVNKPAANSLLLQAVQRPSDTGVNDMLIRAVRQTADQEGWANIAAVGNYLRNFTPIDYKAYGFETLKRFLESTKLFEMKIEQRSPRAKDVDSVSIRVINRGGA